MFSRVVVVSKQVALVLGATSAICAAYIAVGLPMPMSEAAVNQKISPVLGLLSAVQRSQITILGDLSTVQRQILRNERLALESAIPSASQANKVAFNLRLGQIEDELAKLDRRDEQNAKQLELK